MSSLSVRTVGPLAILLTGCTSSAPWPDDRFVLGTEQSTTTSRQFLLVAGSDPVETVGLRGFGATCDEAAESSGWSRSQTVLTSTRTYETFGRTRTEHPLLPGHSDYGTVDVNVLVEQIASEGREVTEGETLPAGDDPIPTFDADPTYRATSARFVGLAGTEYLVELFPFSVWSAPHSHVGFEDTGYDPGFPFLASPVEGPGDGPMQATLLTRRKASEGDVWTSLDGRLVYRAGPKEVVTLGNGDEVTARRVDVFTTGGADPNGAGLLAACIIERPTSATELGDDGLILVEGQRAVLDDHCEGEFRHQQVGTEWWWDDVLVRSETTTWTVDIQSWGYQWYEAAEEGEGCTRRTSVSLPDDVSDATLFVAYSVSEELGSYVVDAIGRGVPVEVERAED